MNALRVTPRGVWLKVRWLPRRVFHPLLWRWAWSRTAWRSGARSPSLFLRGISSDSASWTYRLGEWLRRRDVSADGAGGAGDGE